MSELVTALRNLDRQENPIATVEHDGREDGETYAIVVDLRILNGMGMIWKKKTKRSLRRYKKLGHQEGWTVTDETDHEELIRLIQFRR